MLLEQWADTAWALLTVRQKTLITYQGYYRNHVSEALGHKDLESITRRDVQAWVLSLSPSLGEHCLVVLKTLFREACVYGICDNNPTIGIRKKPVTRKPRPFMTWEELDVQDYGRYNNLFRFLALHGLRWSEAQALTPEDLSDYVTVSKSLYGPTKNTQTRRVPYMGYYEDPFPRSYKWAYERLQPYTIHSLRKTYAYTLKRSGVHVQVAQRLLGHSSIQLTFDTYTEVLPDEVDFAGEQIRTLLASY